MKPIYCYYWNDWYYCKSLLASIISLCGNYYKFLSTVTIKHYLECLMDTADEILSSINTISSHFFKIFLCRTFIMDKFHFDADEANWANGLIYLISAVASPIFGLILDKTGRNIMWVWISIIMAVFAHSLLAFTEINPYYGLVSS